MKIIQKIGLPVLFFGGGLAVGILFVRDVSRWMLDYTVSVPHILNLITTLAVAFVVQHMLKQQAERNQGKRELLAAQLTLVRTALEAVREAHSKSKDGKPPTGAAKLVRQVSNAIATLESCAKALSIETMEQPIKDLRLKCSDYRVVMTTTDVPFEFLTAEESWSELQQEIHLCLAKLYNI